MEIGSIKAVHIYVHDEHFVTAELELNIKGVNYAFGGERVFRSGYHGGDRCDAPYLGRFLFRCMQVCKADSWDLLKNQKVLAHTEDGQVVAIADVSGNNWFNPRLEFELMDQEKHGLTGQPSVTR
ncbi:hypothetical protein [Dyadobacter sandarakinus]|uniref:Uncharacterized protein n=1 Tax=Dyadobacter sandarakinus TaxID=2747268 RepID=A0ABX7I4W9_9BACT|nr:hypothetical protein [Dyadobacter sandarakinus]QRR00980.1 hypothetical protein HWI92_08745 [Dyadobacter sandarakinus]